MIKQPTYAILGGIIFVGFLLYSFERLNFLRTAEKTTGTVASLYAENDRCGGKHKHNCTEFYARVHFRTRKEESAEFVVGAGKTRGHNQSLNYADRKVGDEVAVIYAPHNPTKSYVDTLWGVWGGPLMTLFVSFTSLFSSFSEPRRRKWTDPA